MIEIFKEIEGYENYQVSNYGSVKSLGNGKTRKEKVLKPFNTTKGYLQVELSKQGKRKNYYVHRLVAQAFLQNPNNYEEVNHKDEDKTNNHVTNLEWCDRKYNINYGTLKEKISKQVLCVETGVVYPSTMEVQRQLGFAQTNISKCCNGKLKQAYGYTWRYV